MSHDIWTRADAGDTSAGIVSGNPRVLVLLSDGENSPQYGSAPAAIQAAIPVKAAGITIFAVGFGGVSIATLQSIASPTYADAL